MNRLEAFEVVAMQGSGHHRTYIVVAPDIPSAIRELHDFEPSIKRIQSVNLKTPAGGVVVVRERSYE